MARKQKSVVYKIPKPKARTFSDFPSDIRDAAALSAHASAKAEKGDCNGAFSTLMDAAQAFGRADAKASGTEKSQVDQIHSKMKRAQAAVGTCFRRK